MINRKIEIHRYSEIKLLEKDWNRLAYHQSPFQQYYWYELLIQDWCQKRLVYKLLHPIMFYVLLINGEVQAIFPIEKLRFSTKVSLFRNSWSDYADIIGGYELNCEDLFWFIKKIMELINGKSLVLDYVPFDSILHSLRDKCKIIELTDERFENEYGCYVLGKPESFSHYLEQRGSHFKKNYKWRKNKLIRNNVQLDFSIEKCTHELGCITDMLYKKRRSEKNNQFMLACLRLRRWIFESHKNESNIISMLKERCLDLRIIVMRMNSEVAAYGLILFSPAGDSCYLLQTAFNSIYSSYSPSIIMFTEFIEAWSDGKIIYTDLISFDFTRGAEPYKIMLGATRRILYHIEFNY